MDGGYRIVIDVLPFSFGTIIYPVGVHPTSAHQMTMFIVPCIYYLRMVLDGLARWWRARATTKNRTGRTN